MRANDRILRRELLPTFNSQITVSLRTLLARKKRSSLLLLLPSKNSSFCKGNGFLYTSFYFSSIFTLFTSLHFFFFFLHSYLFLPYLTIHFLHFKKLSFFFLYSFFSTVLDKKKRNKRSSFLFQKYFFLKREWLFIFFSSIFIPVIFHCSFYFFTLLSFSSLPYYIHFLNLNVLSFPFIIPSFSFTVLDKR